MPINKILCLTDLSELSAASFKAALYLARCSKAEVLLHYSADEVEHDKRLEDELRLKGRLRAFARSAGIEALKGVNVQYHVSYGSLIQNVAKLVDRAHVDLVVMGTSGEQGWSRLFNGSGARSVLEQVNCPALVLPKGADLSRVQSIGLGLDLEFIEHMDSIAFVGTVAEALGVSVTAFHVQPHDRPLSMETELEQRYLMATVGSLVEKQVVHEVALDVFEGIQQLTEKHQEIGFLAIVHRSHGWLDQLLGKSVAVNLLNEAKLPLLLVHAD